MPSVQAVVLSTGPHTQEALAEHYYPLVWAGDLCS